MAGALPPFRPPSYQQSGIFRYQAPALTGALVGGCGDSLYLGLSASALVFFHARKNANWECAFFDGTNLGIIATMQGYRGKAGADMTKNLRERAEITAQEVLDILGPSKTNDPEKVADSIEQAIIKALVDERQRCAEVALECCPEDQDKAHKIAEEIRRVRSVLITNLSSMR